MNTWFRGWLFLLGGLFALSAQAQPARQVEVCFVLDTTGSMSGLIAAAKEKIWYLANLIAKAPGQPKIRLCLLGFRDRGDAYVTRHSPLSEDIDQLYADLLAFQADGGGDTPEAVNQALLEAVEHSGWSPDPQTRRLIFLFGDAPPHTDYAEPQYDAIVQTAAARGILVNPVLCGNDASAQRIFEQIAGGAGGRMAQIASEAPTRRLNTPMDQDLAALSRYYGQLLLPYGEPEQQAALWDKQQRAERMGDSGAAERMAFNRSSARLVNGRGDLLQDLDAGAVSLDRLPAEQLPLPLRSMRREEMLDWLAKRRLERAAAGALVDRLLAQREAYLNASAAEDFSGFEGVVQRTMQQQLGGE